ncbi:MAG: GntR family transcriptional regulator [Ruminococcaceae bacterium]|nr:GntR family transcriptional regulator [Oscillospiraceae bacterium]
MKSILDKNVHSLTERVFSEIEQAILSGIYSVGDQLVESKISLELGVSRTPVREALKQLELEGLVTTIPNKGTFVVGVSTEDILDIYTIRVAVEGISSKLAAERITDSDAKELETLVELQEFYASKGDIFQLLQLDTKFHEIIYEISGSRILKHTLASFHNQLKRARESSLLTTGRTITAVKEHRDIYEAIASKDANKAKELTELHITNARDNILLILKSGK